MNSPKSSSRRTQPPHSESMSIDAANNRRMVEASARGDDLKFDRLCRPTTLDDYVGQQQHKENLKVFVQAARRRGEPLDHVLLCGPPGLGKTTLATILANEMGVQVHTTSGPAIEHKGALAGHLTRLEQQDVFFIDEIHRLTASVEETLYPAIENFQLDVMMGDGPHASTIQIDLQPFTLVGATTRTGLLTGPLLSRFGYVVRLDFYPEAELMQIVQRSARLLGISITPDGAQAVAQRSRGTPRVANRLLRRVSDFALVLRDGCVDAEIASEACARLGIDHGGLDEMDRRLLTIIIDSYEGGPVGLDTLAAAMAEARDTIEDVYEPFLLQQGFLGRTPRGRIATHKAYTHLEKQKPQGIGSPPSTQEKLF